MTADDLAFLERYLMAGFSIKAMAEQNGMGYTAIRRQWTASLRAMGSC